MNRWHEYFQELLVEERKDEEMEAHEEVPVRSEEDKISLEELQEAIRKLKYGKAPGCDRITSEMVKNMGRKGVELLLKIYNRVWRDVTLPNDWRKALIMPIYKKGDRRDCSNYRGITLLSTVMKIFEGIIDRRIRTALADTLDDAQSGFRSGRSTQDHVFSIKQIAQKALQERKKVFLAFLDLEKAFDKVQTEILWKVLKKINMNTKLIQMIKEIYKPNINYVIYNNSKSEMFMVKGGLRQGGALSPTLFIIFMNEIIKTCSVKCKKLLVGHWKMERVKVSEGVFADDVVLIASSERDLQENLEIWNLALKEVGMKINKKNQSYGNQ